MDLIIAKPSIIVLVPVKGVVAVVNAVALSSMWKLAKRVRWNALRAPLAILQNNRVVMVWCVSDSGRLFAGTLVY